MRPSREVRSVRSLNARIAYGHLCCLCLNQLQRRGWSRTLVQRVEVYRLRHGKQGDDCALHLLDEPAVYGQHACTMPRAHSLEILLNQRLEQGGGKEIAQRVEGDGSLADCRHQPEVGGIEGGGRGGLHFGVRGHRVADGVVSGGGHDGLW